MYSQTAPRISSHRIAELDVLRGIAIILMAVFHFCYDLSYFNYIAMSVKDPFWAGFRIIILTLFFSVSGYSLVLAHQNGIRWRKFLFRWGQIGLGALAITVATYVAFPKAWVYFGVLHFIFVALIVALPFIRFPLVSLVTGIVIFLLYYLTDWFNTSWLYNWLKPILHLPRATQDLTRFIPWFGLVLLGVWLAYQNNRWLQWPEFAGKRFLAWIGRYSLSIYLIHQIVLFGLVWSFYQLQQLWQQ
jgi:uncharacterized membrane protein